MLAEEEDTVEEEELNASLHISSFVFQASSSSSTLLLFSPYICLYTGIILTSSNDSP
jgi:hypothetical protein